jgi:hypothetical protein
MNEKLICNFGKPLPQGYLLKMRIGKLVEFLDRNALTMQKCASIPDRRLPWK